MPEELFLKGGDGDMKAVSTAPSMNKTPVGSAEPPLPYQVIADLTNAVDCSPNVFFNGMPAYLLNRSSQPSCKGDSPGSKKGVKKGTVNGKVKPTSGSSTVRINGQPPVRIGDTCEMQGSETVGRYVMAPPPNPFKFQSDAPMPSFEPPPSKDEQVFLDFLEKMEEIEKENKQALEAAIQAQGQALMDAEEKLRGEIKDLYEKEFWNPSQAMARKNAEWKERLANPRPSSDIPELTDASKPKKLSLAEKETAWRLDYIRNWISKAQLFANVLAFAGPLAGALANAFQRSPNL